MTWGLSGYYFKGENFVLAGFHGFTERLLVADNLNWMAFADRIDCEHLFSAEVIVLPPRLSDFDVTNVIIYFVVRNCVQLFFKIGYCLTFVYNSSLF